MSKNSSCVRLTKCRLGDYITDIASGPFGSNLKVECFTPTGFPIVDGANLTGLRVTDNITKFVSESKARSLSRSIAKRGDVVVTISGTLGQVAYIPHNSRYEEYLCSQRQFRVTFDESRICVEYLVNLLHTQYGQRKILAFANYVGVPALSQPIPNFKNIELHLPDMPTQLRIAGILGSLDEKIELNRKKIAELEALAKTIYDYWFVQFDFPDANGKPYKSSGGKMVWNDQLKREVPGGWKSVVLSELAHYQNRKVDAARICIENYVSTENMLPDRGGVSLANTKPSCGNVNSFDKKDILVANIRPYFKKIWMANRSGGSSSDVLCVVPDNRRIAEYIFETLSQDAFFEYVVQGSKGTKMPRGDKRQILNYPLCLPNNEYAERYSRLIDTLQERRSAAESEIAELTTLRDTLLPLLMNGQVFVR